MSRRRRHTPEQIIRKLRDGELERIRRALLAKAARRGERPQVDDQISYPNQSSQAFRILSAYRTPDAVLFQRTTDPRVFVCPFPTGLEVCIALGSSHAARCLDDPEREKVLKTIERSKNLFRGTSLYADYLKCLSTLLGAPPAGAPEFMPSGAWQTKSCQTALAGWAQWRHTWILHTKQTCVWLCAEDWEKPVGFVEPNPTFFGRVHDLAERAAQLLNRVRLQNVQDLYAVAELQNLLQVLEAKAASGSRSTSMSLVPRTSSSLLTLSSR